MASEASGAHDVRRWFILRRRRDFEGQSQQMAFRRGTRLLRSLVVGLVLAGPASPCLADPCPACHGTGQVPGQHAFAGNHRGLGDLDTSINALMCDRLATGVRRLP